MHYKYKNDGKNYNFWINKIVNKEKTILGIIKLIQNIINNLL